MNSTPWDDGLGGGKRKYESDDDPIIISNRPSERRLRKRLAEVADPELRLLVGDSSQEMPINDDFGATGLDPTRFAWAPKSAIALMEKLLREENPRAPSKADPPHVPDPTDQNWENEQITSFNPRSRPHKRAPKSKRFVYPEDDDDIQIVSESRVSRTSIPKTPKGKWVFPVPLEIREMIYRNLLRSSKPIAVYDGWERVYKHGNTRQTGPAFTDRPSLDINILGVNKWIYPEAARILYSENTFLYRLRDPAPISSPPVDLDALISYNPPPSNRSLDGDDPNDEDYQEDIQPSNTRRTRSTRKNKDSSGPRINVSKFLHLYRHIIIEADHNRFSDDTLTRMADAIQIFNNPPPVDKDSLPLYPSAIAPESSKKKRKTGRKVTQRVSRQDSATPTVLTPNIMTLVIKIRPSRVPNGYSFVNFFDKKSPIPQALRDLRPHQLYVKVMMGQFTQQRNGVCLPISFRHQRIVCLAASGEPDMWARDREMIIRRKRKAIESLRKLEDLSKSVQKFCNKYLVEHGNASEENGEFDLDWLEIADDESDFEIQHIPQAEASDGPQAEVAQEVSEPEVQDEVMADSQGGLAEETDIQNEVTVEPLTEDVQETIQTEAQEAVEDEAQEPAERTIEDEGQELLQDKAQEPAQDETQIEVTMEFQTGIAIEQAEHFEAGFEL